jgi:hypothetical protein
MFRTVPLSIIRNFSLYTQQRYTSEQDQEGTSWSYSQAVSKPVWHISLLCVQWKTPDDGNRNCPKHVKFYSKNKLETLVQLAGFLIRIHHDARLPECQITHHIFMRIFYACRFQLKCDGTRWRTGGEVKGKLANGVGSQYPSHYLVYPALLPLMRTPRLPVVDWTDAPPI